MSNLPKWYDPEGCDGCEESVRMATALKIAWEALDHCKEYSPDLYDSEDGLQHSENCPACKAKDAMRRIRELETE